MLVSSFTLVPNLPSLHNVGVQGLLSGGVLYVPISPFMITGSPQSPLESGTGNDLKGILSVLSRSTCHILTDQIY